MRDLSIHYNSRRVKLLSKEKKAKHQFFSLKMAFLAKAKSAVLNGVKTGKFYMGSPVGGYYDRLKVSETGRLELSGWIFDAFSGEWRSIASVVTLEGLVNELGKIMFRSYLMKHNFTAARVTWLWYNTDVEEW